MGCGRDGTRIFVAVAHLFEQCIEDSNHFNSIVAVLDVGGLPETTDTFAAISFGNYGKTSGCPTVCNPCLTYQTDITNNHISLYTNIS